jgi:hypothetical protein
MGDFTAWALIAVLSAALGVLGGILLARDQTRRAEASSIRLRRAEREEDALVQLDEWLADFEQGVGHARDDEDPSGIVFSTDRWVRARWKDWIAQHWVTELSSRVSNDTIRELFDDVGDRVDRALESARAPAAPGDVRAALTPLLDSVRDLREAIRLELHGK